MSEPIYSRCLELETPKDYPTTVDQTIAEMCNHNPRELFMFTVATLSWTFDSFYTQRAEAIKLRLTSLEPKFE